MKKYSLFIGIFFFFGNITIYFSIISKDNLQLLPKIYDAVNDLNKNKFIDIIKKQFNKEYVRYPSFSLILKIQNKNNNKKKIDNNQSINDNKKILFDNINEMKKNILLYLEYFVINDFVFEKKEINTKEINDIIIKYNNLIANETEISKAKNINELLKLKKKIKTFNVNNKDIKTLLDKIKIQLYSIRTKLIEIIRENIDDQKQRKKLIKQHIKENYTLIDKDKDYNFFHQIIKEIDYKVDEVISKIQFFNKDLNITKSDLYIENTEVFKNSRHYQNSPKNFIINEKTLLEIDEFIMNKENNGKKLQDIICFKKENDANDLPYEKDKIIIIVDDKYNVSDNLIKLKDLYSTLAIEEIISISKLTFNQHIEFTENNILKTREFNKNNTIIKLIIPLFVVFLTPLIIFNILIIINKKKEKILDKIK